MKKFIFLLLLTFSQLTFSGEWCKLPRSDEQTKYFLGVSTPLINKSESIEEAMNKAKTEVVRSIFGTYYSINKRLFSTENDFSLDIQNEEFSELEFVKDLIADEIVTTEKDNMFESCVIVKLSKNEINSLKKNKSRLFKKDFQSSILTYSGYNLDNNSLIIKSNPSFSKVTVNGEHYGLTPMVIKNLPKGNYQIKVEKKGFESQTKSISLLTNENRNVGVNLRPKDYTLSILTNINGANVKVNNKYVGTSPIFGLKVKNKKVKIEINDMKTYPLVTLVDLSEDDTQVLQLELTLKPLYAKQLSEENFQSEKNNTELFRQVSSEKSDMRIYKIIKLDVPSYQVNKEYFNGKSEPSIFGVGIGAQLNFNKSFFARLELNKMFNNSDDVTNSMTSDKNPIVKSMSGYNIIGNLVWDLGPIYIGYGIGHEKVNLEAVSSKSNQEIIYSDSGKISKLSIGTICYVSHYAFFDLQYNEINNKFKYIKNKNVGFSFAFGVEF